MSEILVSLITSAYRSDRYLEEYFKNICSQSIFNQMETILVLNEPSFGESIIANKYLDLFPEQFRIITVPRESIGASTNRGYLFAKGKYLAYADVDDIREPNCYERLFKTLEENNDCDFTYGDFVIVNKFGKRQGSLIKTIDFDRDKFIRSSFTGANHFFRREILDKCGYWDEQFRSGGDFEFQVRAAFKCKFIKTQGEPLFYYTREPQSNSASSISIQPIERTVVELRYGIYDKIDNRYIKDVEKYNIENILFKSEWHNIRKYICNYDEYMDKKKHLQNIRIINNRFNRIKIMKEHFHCTIKLILKWIMDKIGIYNKIISLRQKYHI